MGRFGCSPRLGRLKPGDWHLRGRVSSASGSPAPGRWIYETTGSERALSVLFCDDRKGHPLVESLSDCNVCRPIRIDSRGRQSACARRLLFLCLLSVFLLAVGQSGIYSQEVPDEKAWLGEVTGSMVNVRTGASTNHFPFMRLARGSDVVAVGGKGEWVEILVPAYRKIWIHRDYVEEAGENLRVKGSRVRLRATPGTRNAPLGMTRKGQILILAGEDDSNAEWVGVMAPMEAHAFIHRDYIDHKNDLEASMVATVFRGIRPVALAGATTTDSGSISGAPGGGDDKKGSPEKGDGREIRMLGALSERLQPIYEKFQSETKKNPRDWQFASILESLLAIEKGSEDVAEIEVAVELSRNIREHWLPLHQRIVVIEKDQAEARRQREIAKSKETEILRRTGQRGSREEKQFLAVGWIVPLGKHRKVEGTHKLLKGNRLLYYLKSDEVDLNEYVNKRVGVEGVVEEQPPSAGAQLIRLTRLKVLSE